MLCKPDPMIKTLLLGSRLDEQLEAHFSYKFIPMFPFFSSK